MFIGREYGIKYTETGPQHSCSVSPLALIRITSLIRGTLLQNWFPLPDSGL